MQKGLAPLYLVHVHSRRRKLLEYVERMCLGLWFYINGSRLMRRTASFDLKSKTSPLLFFLSTFPVWWLMSLVSRFGLCCLAREQKELGRELFGCFFEKAFLGGSSTISTCTRKLDKLFCLYYYTFRSYLSIYSFFYKWEKRLIRCLLFSRPFCQQDKNAPVAKFPREPMTWHRSRHAVSYKPSGI